MRFRACDLFDVSTDMVFLYQVVTLPYGLDLNFIFCSNSIFRFVLMEFDCCVLEFFLDFGTDHWKMKKIVNICKVSNNKKSSSIWYNKFSMISRTNKNKRKFLNRYRPSKLIVVQAWEHAGIQFLWQAETNSQVEGKYVVKNTLKLSTSLFFNS